MRHLYLMTLLAGSAAIAGCATAPRPTAVAVAGGQVCATGSIDADGDGAVTAAEWNAWRASGFAFWDTNKDNRIDRSEFEACYRPADSIRPLITTPTIGPTTGPRSTRTATAI